MYKTLTETLVKPSYAGSLLFYLMLRFKEGNIGEDQSLLQLWALCVKVVQLAELQSFSLSNFQEFQQFIMQEYVHRDRDKVKPYIKYLMRKLRLIKSLRKYIIMGDESHIDVSQPIAQRVRFNKFSF